MRNIQGCLEQEQSAEGIERYNLGTEQGSSRAF